MHHDLIQRHALQKVSVRRLLMAELMVKSGEPRTGRTNALLPLTLAADNPRNARRQTWTANFRSWRVAVKLTTLSSNGGEKISPPKGTDVAVFVGTKIDQTGSKKGVNTWNDYPNLAGVSQTKRSRGCTRLLGVRRYSGSRLPSALSSSDLAVYYVIRSMRVSTSRTCASDRLGRRWVSE